MRDWLENRRLNLAERVGQELPRPFIVEAAQAPEDPEVTRQAGPFLSRPGRLPAVGDESGPLSSSVPGETPVTVYKSGRIILTENRSEALARFDFFVGE